MQHGVAAAEVEDPARPLTAAGRAAVARVAAHARAVGIRPATCVHSGKLRARQTAHVLARTLGVLTTEERPDLNPGDPVEPVADWIATRPVESLAVVGHLPFLERLTGLLVAGDPEARVVAFHNAGLVALVPNEGRYAVDWVLVPSLVLER